MSGLTALDPVVAEELGHLVDGLWDGRIDTTLVERCRARMCVLLGADPTTARPASAPEVVGEPDERERACLAFAEQWVLDAHAMTDEQAAAVRRHLSESECAALTIALAVLEAQVRADIALVALR